MFFVLAPLVWLWGLLNEHPWLWLVVIAVVIGGWLLGREQDYTRPPKPLRKRRPSLAEVRAEERAAFVERSKALRHTYDETRERIRRLSE